MLKSWRDKGLMLKFIEKQRVNVKIIEKQRG